jgi:quercetin dioxygenase-like cupin family protein
MSGVFPDAKMVKRDLEPGEVVQSHQHKRGHVTVILGDCTMILGGGREVRVINDAFYVPAEMEHSIRANARSRMFCIGREDF